MPSIVDPTSPPRKPPLPWRTTLLREFRRWKLTWTRENVTNNLKTMAWVIPLTLLIWVYAEREQVAKLNGVTVVVQVRCDQPGYSVSLSKLTADSLPPDEMTVTIAMEGPQSHLGTLQNQLNPMSGIAPMIVTVSPGGGPVDLAASLSTLPVFIKQGMTVFKSEPPDVQAKVEKIEDFQKEIGQPSVKNLETYTFDPKTALVRGPASLVNGMIITADLRGMHDLNVPGEHTDVVPLIKSTSDERVTLVTRTAKATIAVGQDDESYIIKQIHVELRIPGPTADKYIVDYPRLIPNITIKGPADKIAAIRKAVDANEAPISATLKIDEKDALNPPPKTVKFEGLPEGVEVVKEDREKTYTFTMTPR